jgi:hypothetical protein
VKPKPKTGRPLAVIDPAQVEALARIHCTHAEIAAVLGCHKDTITNRFSDLIEKGKEEGRASLRRQQWKLATAGNATMCIWLGKQLLGQQDRQTLEHSGPDGGPIEVQAHELRSRLASRVAGIAARVGARTDHPEPHGGGGGGT